MDIKNILEAGIEHKASDVHINVGLRPVMRINTELANLKEYEVVDEKTALQMLKSIITDKMFEKFEEFQDLDFSTTVADGTRFRVNAHVQRGTIAMSFRIIPSDIPTIQDLNLPSIVEELADLPRGLIVVTGHTGAGKSTTMASMINTINSKYGKRIITMEDPVEYELTNDCSMIEQREIGQDCPKFASGLKHVLRQDPDVILVGEMRDLETTSSTITAAETGHLVFSTLHTVNASQTVERIIDIYPANQQNQIRAMLSNTLQAVISQTLIKRSDQPGMVPCNEILLCNSAVRNCIRENRIYEIPNIIETNRRIGMQTMDHSITQSYEKGYISKEQAITFATNPGKMTKNIEEIEKQTQKELAKAR